MFVKAHREPKAFSNINRKNEVPSSGDSGTNPTACTLRKKGCIMQKMMAVGPRQHQTDGNVQNIGLRDSRYIFYVRGTQWRVTRGKDVPYCETFGYFAMNASILVTTFSICGCILSVCLLQSKARSYSRAERNRIFMMMSFHRRCRSWWSS